MVKLAVIYVNGKAKKIVIHMGSEAIALKVPHGYDVEINDRVVKRKKVGNKEVVVAKLNVFELATLLNDYIHVLQQVD
jgi:hypothetical protein